VASRLPQTALRARLAFIPLAWVAARPLGLEFSQMNRFRALTAALSLVGIVTFFDASGQAYSTFGKWASTSVPFYLNPQNGSVSADDAEKAFKTALDAWSDATKSPFSYSYGGRVDDTSLGYDGRNVAVFRTDADASEIARTYVWSLNGTIVDADIVFSDVRLTFFTGATGCEDAGEGGYIEDLFVDYTGKPVRKGEPLFSIYSPDFVSAEQEYLLALQTQKALAQSQVPSVAESAASLVRSKLRQCQSRPS